MENSSDMSNDIELNEFSDFDLEEARTVYGSRKSINKKQRDLTPRISTSDKTLKLSFLDKSVPE